MRRFAFVSDILIRSFFIFLIAYLWASFYIRGFALSFIAAFLVTCLVNAGIMFVQNKRQTRKTRTRERVEHMQKIALQFKFLTPAQSLALVEEGIDILGKDISGQSIHTYLHKPVTEADIIEAIYKTSTGKKTVVIAQDFPPELKVFFAGLKIDLELVNFEVLYDELLDKTQTFPPITIEKSENKKLRWREIHRLFFNRRKAKSFLVVGIFILLTSFIVRPSLYYIIIATIVFGIAIIGFFLPNQNKSNIFN